MDKETKTLIRSIALADVLLAFLKEKETGQIIPDIVFEVIKKLREEKNE